MFGFKKSSYLVFLYFGKQKIIDGRNNFEIKNGDGHCNKTRVVEANFPTLYQIMCFVCARSAQFMKKIWNKHTKSRVKKFYKVL